ncbi:MAG TPA: 50S ribosomal protein L31e [Nanoarchaeota archaeon]|nr:MAG: large subunit ribosomal protein L31e [archaeon GW2011_AR6]MBS3083163.1 50S ribosomal protein L31e [Candidatus Pacearchaeota archaeon]HIH18261.1 50S ribosomal protein L31e [Nanoarchaeota archaeon]HIH34276.1 50S ribosomal protein L31e [Nanoarchaeota archaeon]HIH50866.1 50S ribosomal protein L31e [Nanoarchaeota archaeon]
MAQLERIYTIPIRREWEKVSRFKRAKKAVKAVREFLAQHMKVYDRDLKKIKIERWLNMALWARGIKHPPTRVKVRAVKDDDGIVRAELADLPKKAKREEEKKLKAKVESEKKKVKAQKEELAEENEDKKEVEAGADTGEEKETSTKTKEKKFKK